MGTQVQGVAAIREDVKGKALNRAQAASFVARFERLTPGTKPAWGRLTSAEVVPHLIAAVKMSMCEFPALPFNGNWVTRSILWPIVRTGLIPVPKNVVIKDKDGTPIPGIQSPGDVTTLAEELETFLKRRESGTMNASPHPLFGDVGAEGWAVLHTMHIRHHLKQFGL